MKASDEVLDMSPKCDLEKKNCHGCDYQCESVADT